MSAKTKPISVSRFKQKVWKYYRAHGRHDLPWRKNITPYRILVSEIMLQQTQVSRVTGKFSEFLKIFPNAKTLARASLSDVLRAWQGLGYNRRAKFLYQATIRSKGVYPKTVEELIKLPGIGVNTAGAIMAYAYNTPVIFIETNIRRVFIHEFFKDAKNVSDVQLLPYITAAIAKEKNPREWYWALMDYGSMLGRDLKLANPNRQSKHYTLQSKFEGSQRQIRGKIITYLLTEGESKTLLAIAKALELSVAKISPIIENLVTEKLLTKRGKKFTIA